MLSKINVPNFELTFTYFLSVGWSWSETSVFVIFTVKRRGVKNRRLNPNI